MTSWREVVRNWLQAKLTSRPQSKGRRLRQQSFHSFSPVPAEVEQLETRALLTFTFHGGPLITNVAAQNVFLGSDWSTNPALKNLEGRLDAFSTTMVSGTQVDGLTLAGYNVYRGSSTPGVVANVALDKSYPASGFGNGLFSFVLDPMGNIIGITENLGSTPAYTGGIAEAPDQAGFSQNIQGLLQSMITSGQLQSPTSDSLYMVYVEPGVIVSSADVSSATGEFANSVIDFGGFHGAFAGTSPGGAALNIRYAIMPFPGFPNTFLGIGGSTQNLAGAFNTLTKVASHEMSEAITDPDIFVTTSAGGTSTVSWFDDVNGGEIADLSEQAVTIAQGYELQLSEDQNNLTINPNAVNHTLAAPTNLILSSLTPTTGQLAWTGSALAQGYKIYSISGGIQTLIGTVGAGANVFGVTAGSNVSYMVQAFNGPSTTNSNTLSGVASFAVSDFTNQNGRAVHLVSTGKNNVVFIDATGHMSQGTFSSATKASTPYWPGDIATFNGNTVTWTDGSVWTKTSNPANKVTVNEYTNIKGVAVFAIQNGTNMLAFVDGAGNTSLGNFLNPTQAVSRLYPGDTASFIGNSVVWQDGYVWLQTSSSPTVLPITAGRNDSTTQKHAAKGLIFVAGTPDAPWNSKVYWSSRSIVQAFGTTH